MLAQRARRSSPISSPALDLPPDDIEDALWELVGAGLATADGFASLRVLVDRRRGEVKSLFDRARRAATSDPGCHRSASGRRRSSKARTRDRERPGHALRSLPTAAGRWSLLPATDRATARSTPRRRARQLLLRYGVVFRDLLARESSLPPWRELLVALRRLEARGEIRGGRFVTGFVGEQFALPEALDELRAVRHPGAGPARSTRIAATDPLNLVGDPVARPARARDRRQRGAVPRRPGRRLARGRRARLRAPLPPGARVDDDLTLSPAAAPRPGGGAGRAALVTRVRAAVAAEPL